MSGPSQRSQPVGLKVMADASSLLKSLHQEQEVHQNTDSYIPDTLLA